MELLDELADRCLTASARLKEESRRHPHGSREQARLEAKSDGVLLVIDYLREARGCAEGCACGFELERAQLALIEARNPGIDVERVARERQERAECGRCGCDRDGGHRCCGGACQDDEYRCPCSCHHLGGNCGCCP